MKTTPTKTRRQPDGLDHLEAAKKRDAARHDHAIRDYSPGLVLDAAADLRNKRYWNPSDPEHRWGMARLAALLRKADHLRIL